jgi:hypothetical protein
MQALVAVPAYHFGISKSPNRIGSGKNSIETDFVRTFVNIEIQSGKEEVR